MQPFDWHLAGPAYPSHLCPATAGLVRGKMKKLLSGLSIALLTLSLACSNTKASPGSPAGQSSKDEGTNGNPANTPAGGSNTSTEKNAVDKQNQPTAPASGSGSDSNLAGTGSSDNGANPSSNDSSRPHSKKSNEGKSVTAPKK